MANKCLNLFRLIFFPFCCLFSDTEVARCWGKLNDHCLYQYRSITYFGTLAVPKPCKTMSNYWGIAIFTKRFGFPLICHLKGCALCCWPLLAPPDCHSGGLVAPFLHPGGPFWHIGSTLEHHGSSRMVSKWSGTVFSSMLERFRDHVLRALLTPRFNVSTFCPGLFPGHFLHRLLTRNSNAWGS